MFHALVLVPKLYVPLAFGIISLAISALKLIPNYFSDDDKLLDEVIPTFFENYLEVYLPEAMKSMRCIAENILKWRINYQKLKDIKENATG